MRGAPLKRQAVEWANRFLRIPAVSRQILRKAVVVFLYHEVSDTPSEFNTSFGLNVTPAVFSRQMDLVGENFHWIDPVQLLQGDYPTPAALITFDDGNRGVFQNALPILKERGIPSVSFLNMGTIQGEICWSGLVTYLQSREPAFGENGRKPVREEVYREFTEPQVKRYLDTVDADALLEKVRLYRGSFATPADLEVVSGNALVYLGNHLYNHYNATLLEEARLRSEYQKNQRILEGHPRTGRLFSYPFSCLNRQTTRILKEEGVEGFFAGAGLPNLRPEGSVYFQVEMDETVTNQENLMKEIFKNCFSHAVHQWLRKDSS